MCALCIEAERGGANQDKLKVLMEGGTSGERCLLNCSPSRARIFISKVVTVFVEKSVPLLVCGSCWRMVLFLEQSLLAGKCSIFKLVIWPLKGSQEAAGGIQQLGLVRMGIKLCLKEKPWRGPSRQPVCSPLVRKRTGQVPSYLWPLVSSSEKGWSRWMVFTWMIALNVS